MNWLRAAVVVAALVLVALARGYSAAAPMLAVPTPVAAPTPTRVPLPTAQPPMIISRVARETPGPVATAIPSAAPEVSIVDYGFAPAQMQVPVGTTVTWVNTGSDGHDVTGDGPGGTWRSGPLAPSERYARDFALPGTYDFVCTIHPEMRGRIVVVQP